MGISKIYFGEFAGLQLANRNAAGSHRLIVKNVRGVTSMETVQAITLPFTSDIARIFDTMRVGDPLIFRLSKKSIDSKIALESIHVLPYWYQTVNPEEWESILNELKQRYK